MKGSKSPDAFEVGVVLKDAGDKEDKAAEDLFEDIDQIYKRN